MSKSKTLHEQLKKNRQNYLIGMDGHNARIKEQKKIIREAKKAIKMHKLLKKQRKTSYKLEQLELAK